MSKHRKFTPEFKAQVVLEVLSGAKSAAEICRQHNFKPQVISAWKALFLENVAQVFQKGRSNGQEQARIVELERLVGRLTLELEVAKKPPASWVPPGTEASRDERTGCGLPDPFGLPGALASAQQLLLPAR
jgi:transposase-like protein